MRARSPANAASMPRPRPFSSMRSNTSSSTASAMVEAVLLLEVESLVRRLDANHLSGRHDPGEINGNRAGPAAAVDEPSFIWNSLISRASGFAAPKGSVPSISIVIARPERRSRTGTDRIWISSSVDVMLYREKPTNQLALFCLPAGAASHSFSFDHRRRPETLRTAIATATVRDQMAFFGHRRFAMDSALEESGFEPLVPLNLRRRRFSEHLSCLPRAASA